MRRALGLAVFFLCLPQGARAQGARNSAPTAAPTGLERLSDELRTLAERVAPSVVRIETKGLTATEGVTGTALVTRARATGSGMIVDPDGYVVTNAHVVEGAERVEVFLLSPRLAKGSILRPRSRGLRARVLGLDRETDLAVLKLEESGLPALAFGNSDTLHEGQLVFAFGSPLGLENSVSMGVVSAVARQLRADDPMIYVQTDASINPGNSGGPLVDASGRIVGLSTFILSQSGGSEGIGFAAPSNIVRTVYERLKAGGRVRRGTIGVRPQTITYTLAAGLGLPREASVILGDVTPGSTAAAAGLGAGDLVLALDGKPMENARQLDVNLYRKNPGEAATITVLRDGRRQDLIVTVGERPEDPERFGGLVEPETNLIPRLGVLVVQLDDEVLKLLPKLRGGQGLLVAARAARDEGEDDLQPGDVIYALNGTLLRSLAELKAAVEGAKRADPLVFQVERKGQLLFLAREAE